WLSTAASSVAVQPLTWQPVATRTVVPGSAWPLTSSGAWSRPPAMWVAFSVCEATGSSIVSGTASLVTGGALACGAGLSSPPPHPASSAHASTASVLRLAIGVPLDHGQRGDPAGAPDARREHVAVADEHGAWAESVRQRGQLRDAAARVGLDDAATAGRFGEQQVAAAARVRREPGQAIMRRQRGRARERVVREQRRGVGAAGADAVASLLGDAH